MSNPEKPPQKWTKKDIERFARSFPLVENRPDVIPNPPTNPAYKGEELRVVVIQEGWEV